MSQIRRIRGKFAATPVDGHDVWKLFKLLIPAGNPKLKNMEILYSTGELPNGYEANPEPFLDRSRPPIRAPVVVCYRCGSCFAGSPARCKEHIFVKCMEKNNMAAYTIDQQEMLKIIEAEYDKDLPNTPPPKKIKIKDDDKTQESLSNSLAASIPIAMSDNRISRLRSYLVRFALTTNAGINSLDNYWLAQALETLRPQCTTTAGISASNLVTSQIPKELVKAERVLSEAILNSDFTVIEVDGWGPSEKRSSLWFQFLGLKVISNSSPDFGVSMYMTGEKAMGASIHDAQRHADCMWDLWLGAKNKIQFAEGNLPKQIISDGAPVMQRALVNLAERFEIEEKFAISRGRCLTHFAHLCTRDLAKKVQWVNTTINNCAVIVAAFRHSTKASAALDKCLREQAASSNEPISANNLTKYVEIRWTSVGQMLSRVCNLQATLRIVPIKFPNLGLNITVMSLLEDNRRGVGGNSFWNKAEMLNTLMCVLTPIISDMQTRGINVAGHFALNWIQLLLTYEWAKENCSNRDFNNVLKQIEVRFNELFSQKEFLLAYLFSGTYRGFGLIKASGGSNAELTALARPYVLDAWRYVVKFIVNLKTLANFEKATTRLHQMIKCLVNQTNQEQMWRVLGTCNDVLRWRQMSKSQLIDDVINKAALHCCSLIPNSAECERSFSKCGLASAGNKGGKNTKTILAHHQICQAADIWKENEIQLAAPGSIPARLLNKSHKRERVISGDPLLPIVNEDLVDALLDSP